MIGQSLHAGQHIIISQQSVCGNPSPTALGLPVVCKASARILLHKTRIPYRQTTGGLIDQLAIH